MPPRTSLIPDKRRLQASKIFVNRGGPIGLFTRKAFEIPAEGPKLLVFYGVGGQGKTSLCRKLVSICEDDQSLSHLRVGSVDLHGRPERGGALGLVWLRNALARGKGANLSFPAFDIAFAHYWQATRPDQPMPSFAARWLGRHDDFASDTTSAAGETVGEMLQTIEGVVQALASATPFVGMGLRRLTGWAIRKGRHEFHKRTNDALAHLFEQGDVIAPHEIERLLPYFLARDLDTHLEKNPEHRFVLFIDEYERVHDKGVAGARLRENPLDKAFRDFAAEANATLFVFFSRERLPWAEIDPDWTEDLEDNQHLLHGLAFEDAEDLLQQAGIEDKKIRQAMIKGATTKDPRSGETTTFPIMLDLQVDHYYALLDGKKQNVEPDDFRVSARGFEKRRNELVSRFLRDYDGALEATLKRLALTRWFDRDVFAYLIRTFATGLQIDAFSTFTQLSFVDEKDEVGRYSIHSLIREAIEDITDKDTIIETHKELFTHYDARSSVEDERDVGPPHLDALAEAFHHKTFGTFDELFAWWGEKREKFESPAFARAIELLCRRMLDLTLAAKGQEHPDTASCHEWLGFCVNEQGRHVEAEPLYQSALDIRLQVLGGDHPSTAAGYNYLAINFSQQGRYEEAAKLHSKALEIRKRALGPDHLDTARSYSNLAANLDRRGQYDKAEKFYRKALESRRRELGRDRPEIADNYNNLAIVVSQQGRYQEAEILLRKALEIHERILGHDHLDTARSYGNLAVTLNKSGNHKDAELLQRKALEILKHVLGEDHPGTANGLNNIAAMIQAQGRIDEAEPVYRTALKIREQILGVNHPETAISYSNLAFCLNALERLDDAYALYKKALEIRLKILDSSHPDVALSCNGLATNLIAQRRYDDAKSQIERAISIARTSLGEEHPLTGRYKYNHAKALSGLKQANEASKTLNEAISILEQTIGSDHNWTLDAIALRDELANATDTTPDDS